jgi:flagellar hook-associated protein 2
METTSSTASIGSSILTSLDSGAGIDSVALAQSLTDAQQAPQEAIIEDNLSQTTAEISGYGLISYQLVVLESSLQTINDADEMAIGQGGSSNPATVSVTAVDGSATPGSYDLVVNQLAQNQSVMSNQYTSATDSINSGGSFDIDLSVGTTVLGTFDESLTRASLRTAIAAGNITITDSSGNSITVTQAEVNAAGNTRAGSETLTGYAAALQAKADELGSFNFSVTVNGSSGVTFTQLTAGNGTIVSAQGAVTAGVPSVTPIPGVAAVYTTTLTASHTTPLTVSDGLTTVTVDSALYTTVEEQIQAIQSAAGYDDLLFTVSENAGSIEFTYKTTNAIIIEPTFSTIDGTQDLGNDVVGVTAVNAPTITTLQIAENADTPEGIMAAINAANTGVTASLVDTGVDGSNYRIVLSGQEGADKVFSVSSGGIDLGFSNTENLLQTAQNAEFEFNGVGISRGSNDVSDVISGVTFSLNTVSEEAVTLTVDRDTSPLKANIVNMINEYNAFNNMLDSLTEPSVEGVELSGALADEKTLARFLSDQLRDAILADSSTPSGPINAMRDIGVSIDRYGQLTFDESKFDNAVATNFDDVVTMLTANTSNQSALDSNPKGLSQDVTNLVASFTDSGGAVYTQTVSANVELANYEQDLADLEVRMDGIYLRYITQFAAMDALVASINNTKSYLATQLENMADTYWKN